MSTPPARLAPAVLAEDLRNLARHRSAHLDSATRTMLDQAADWLDLIEDLCTAHLAAEVALRLATEENERVTAARDLAESRLDGQAWEDLTAERDRLREDRQALDTVAKLCGAPAGSHRTNVVMVVRSMLQDPAVFEARRHRALGVTRRLIDALELFVAESDDPGAGALAALDEARGFVQDGGGSAAARSSPGASAEFCRNCDEQIKRCPAYLPEYGFTCLLPGEGHGGPHFDAAGGHWDEVGQLLEWNSPSFTPEKP